MLTVGILLLSATAVFGFIEVSVSEVETQQQHQQHHVGPSMEEIYDCVSPLYQMMNGNGVFVQTTTIEDIVAQVHQGGYFFRGILGKVAMKKETCGCADGTELVAVHMMTKANAVDSFLTADKLEMESYAKNGYADRGINFYCSPEKDKCGASLPLYRHTSHASVPFSHVMTTNARQSSILDSASWKKEVIVCYIWPKQYNINNFIGEN